MPMKGIRSPYPIFKSMLIPHSFLIHFSESSLPKCKIVLLDESQWKIILKK